MKRVYLDHAAATPLHPDVLSAMDPYFKEKYGNPNSLHSFGQEARAAVDQARMTIASHLGSQPTEIYFTSSGTASCNWALLGSVQKRILEGKKSHLIVSSIEHSAVLQMAKFLEQHYGVLISYIPVARDGLVNVDDIAKEVREETFLISIGAVNNEMGTVQPLEEIGRLCREKNILFHSDACQATRYFELNVEKHSFDLLTLNAAKISGPKGVAVLYVRDGVEISPWAFGGKQEFGMNAGTENVAGIIGMGKAVELLQPEQHSSQVSALRDQLWEGLQEKLPEVHRNGSESSSAPHILNIFLPNVDAETLVKRLDLKGYALSTGSACTSGILEPSHVIMALGYDQQRAKSSLRISLGPENTQDEITAFAEELSESYQALLSS